jgi:hypothetical protein
MPKYPWIEFPLLVLAIVGPLLIVVFRLTVKCETTENGKTVKEPKGIGVRMIQLIALLVLVPAIVILALECRLTGEGTGTILGAIVGYALGGITAAVPKRGDQPAK